MDVEKIKEMVRSTVQEALAEQAAAGVESKAEEALKIAQETVEALTETVESLQKTVSDNAAALEVAESEKVSVETELSAKSEELEAVSVELESLKEEAASVKSELDNLRKDMLIKGRMGILEEAGTARKGDAGERQVAAVREMSNEEFEGYKDEMASLREEFLASVGTSEPAGEATASAEGKDVTPPANVEGALETASVLPNTDTTPRKTDWSKFGPGLAQIMMWDRDKENK